MLIDIEKLPKEGLHVSKDFEFLSLDLVEESAVFLEPAHADAHIQKVGEELMIKGTIHTRLSFVCCRCLTPFDFPVNSKFDLVYYPEDLDIIKEELDEEDLDRMFYFNHKIDLRAVFLEQLNLTFPAKPLCREDCEGICAVCGEVIRESRCSCLVREPETPFSILKILKRD